MRDKPELILLSLPGSARADRRNDRTQYHQYDLEFGVILIVIGMIVLIKPFDVLNFIFIAVGVAVLADSLFKMRIAADAKKFGINTVKHRVLILILTVALMVPAVFGYIATRVNYDMLDYLPEDMETVIGQNELKSGAAELKSGSAKLSSGANELYD